MSSLAQPRLRSAPARPRRSLEPAARDRVVVVGAGAAGVLAAVSLSDAGLRPLVVADGPAPGRGIAYSTTDPLHRLNVPAGRMSVSTQEPDAFVHWLQAHRDPVARPGDFVPRAWYGDYLASVLDELVASGSADLQHGRASAMIPLCDSISAPRGVQITLANGRRLRSSAVVLATGCPPPTADWAPAALASDPRLVLDPWSPGRLDEIAGPGTLPRQVLLVGAGLTMVDVALSVAARNPLARITVVSRSGLLPTAHRTPGSKPSPAIAAPDVPAGRMELETVRDIVAASVAAAVRETGDWRPGIDALRSITPALWAALSLPDRARFLAEDRRRWDVLRHRMAPQVADSIHALRCSGRLHVQPLGHGGVAAFPWQSFDAVVSCTGQAGPLSDDPLLAGMIAGGSARPDPLELGLDCDEHGRPRSRSGRVWHDVNVIGALRRGQLWESTAIPELRAQAAALANRLAAQLTSSAAPGWR